MALPYLNLRRFLLRRQIWLLLVMAVLAVFAYRWLTRPRDIKPVAVFPGVCIDTCASGFITGRRNLSTRKSFLSFYDWNGKAQWHVAPSVPRFPAGSRSPMLQESYQLFPDGKTLAIARFDGSAVVVQCWFAGKPKWQHRIPIKLKIDPRKGGNDVIMTRFYLQLWPSGEVLLLVYDDDGHWLTNSPSTIISNLYLLDAAGVVARGTMPRGAILGPDAGYAIRVQKYRAGELLELYAVKRKKAKIISIRRRRQSFSDVRDYQMFGGGNVLVNDVTACDAAGSRPLGMKLLGKDHYRITERTNNTHIHEEGSLVNEYISRLQVLTLPGKKLWQTGIFPLHGGIDSVITTDDGRYLAISQTQGAYDPPANFISNLPLIGDGFQKINPPFANFLDLYECPGKKRASHRFKPVYHLCNQGVTTGFSLFDTHLSGISSDGHTVLISGQVTSDSPRPDVQTLLLKW